MKKVTCYKVARTFAERCDDRRTTMQGEIDGSRRGAKPRLVCRDGFGHGGGHHGANGIDHQFGLVEVNPVLAVSREDLVSIVSDPVEIVL